MARVQRVALTSRSQHNGYCTYTMMVIDMCVHFTLLCVPDNLLVLRCDGGKAGAAAGSERENSTGNKNEHEHTS